MGGGWLSVVYALMAAAFRHEQRTFRSGLNPHRCNLNTNCSRTGFITPLPVREGVGGGSCAHDLRGFYPSPNLPPQGERGFETASSFRRQRWSVAIWLCVVVAVGCAGATGTAQQRARRDTEGRLFHKVVADLSDPLMQGRGAGTQGLDRARDYVVARFEAAGLEPGFVINSQRSYTQPFEVSLGVAVQHQSLELLATDGGGHAQQWKGSEDFTALGFSATGAFEGDAVFVGYGIVDPDHDYDSYSGLGDGALAGKVAVTLRYEPSDQTGKSLWAGGDGQPGRWTQSASLLNKARWAAQHGAVALLVVNGPKQDRGDLKSLSRSTADELAAIPVLHVRPVVLERMIQATGRDPQTVIGVYEQRADAGNTGPDELAGVVVRGDVALQQRSTMIENVAGVLPGHGSLADEVVVVGAHYDHLGYGEVGSLSGQNAVHPGADDNASGVAGVVLLMQRMSGSTVVDDDAQPRRAVVFVAFSGEERGLLGSAYLMKHLDDLGLRADQIAAMVNLDMIGRLEGKKMHVIGTGSGDRWRELLQAAARGVGVELELSERSFGGSDHMSFLVRDVPAVHFFTGSHSDYHQVTDTAEKIDVPGSLRVVDVLHRLVKRLRDDPRRLTYVYDPGSMAHSVTQTTHGSGGAFLGIMPDYASMDGDAGCELSGVVPGSPAKAAGLAADDVIVAWNGDRVRSVRGLSAKLRDSKPGDDVVLSVCRGGKLIELRVTLGQRSR